MSEAESQDRPSRRELLAEEIAREEERLTQLEAEQEQLRARIEKLRWESRSLSAEKPERFFAVELPLVENKPVPQTPASKVALFRDLFRGRPDVFPKFWANSRTKKKGYAPACGNEWVRGVCDKPRVKCGECPNQTFLSVTD